ncbi:WD-repeat protein [Pyrus ussuriensis x Pyrus communis]|uniref:WD-repeat protein n=1 Tax=Pyrus ussuriensis x Pyrus communis TaxID=2448454 RepID=A0A5N5GVS7_9ROSA|nr:WD-repeat protein [Pyrus ussuriensis x Pyrus communis]
MVRSIKNPKKAKRKATGSKKGDASSSSSEPSMPAKVWQPGVDKLEEGQELQCDPSAYNSLRAFHIETLGLVRTEFPHTVYFVAGTQVSFIFLKSCLEYLKVSNISGKKRELVPAKATDDDSNMDSI